MTASRDTEAAQGGEGDAMRRVQGAIDNGPDPQSLERLQSALHAEEVQPRTGPFYVYDEPTIERADLHGCLDEDIETGDPIACAACAIPPGKSTP